MNGDSILTDYTDARLGMRLFLFTEILLFGCLFLLYSVYLSRFPNDFLFCAGTLDMAVGTFGALILLSGGLAMSLAVSSLKKEKRRNAALFLSAAIFSGAAFLISRFVEWSALFKMGLFPNAKILLQHTPGENIFYSLYYLATGLHGLYVASAIAILSVMLFKATRKSAGTLTETESKRPAPRVDNPAAFWYLLCGIGTFLLPLFYFADIPAKYLPLLPYIIFLMLLLHLPYSGMLWVCAALSTIYRKWKPDLSAGFINLAPLKLPVWIVFGFLPPLALAFLYKLLLSNSPIPIGFFLLSIMLLNVPGFFLLLIYRRTGHFIAGAVGAAAVLGYCFLFFDITSLLVFPEKWFFLKTRLPYPFFSITPLLHFAEFILLSFIISGAGILFFYNRRPEQPPHYKLMKLHGCGLMLAGTLPLPLILLPDLFNFPGYSLSISVYVLSGLMIAVLCVIAYAALAIILDKEKKRNVPGYAVFTFILSIALFGLMTGRDRALETSANIENAAVLEMDAVKTWNDFTAKHEELYAKTTAPDEKLGEQIVNERCSACHGFDRKVLGPPFNNVLPKYFNKQDQLEAYIKNPKRVDPQYPAMANPGLTTMQIKSVVKFLMLKMGVKDDSAGN